MEESILLSVKKMLGITSDYTHFDTDIIMHINSVLMILTQMGVGPASGFFITGEDETWNEYIPEADNDFEAIRSYIYLKVKLLFDPPVGSVVMECHKQLINELEWRLNWAAELRQ